MRTLSAGLDYYKLTMSQFAWRHNPDVVVTFTLKNRGAERLLDFIDLKELQATFDAMRERGWTNHELIYFQNLKNTQKGYVFHQEFIDYLRHHNLPKVNVYVDDSTGDLGVNVSGTHALVTFWETIVMAEINEAYFAGLVKNSKTPLNPQLHGIHKLDAKIKVLQEEPSIKFSDFGTRRHFSFEWQRYVVNRVKFACEGFVGTSNLDIARTEGAKPIGTFAHEMPMVMAALADARGDDIPFSHNRFLLDWHRMYGVDLSIALTDTFTDDFFFSEFTSKRLLASYRGLRHDSGNPFDFGERVLHFYATHGVNPMDKTIVFSDGLDLDTIVRLHQAFAKNINVMFGWGTSLTNDVGLKPLNIVMKATHVHDRSIGRGEYTVKLSNDSGKHTGPEDKIELYKRLMVS